MQIKPSMSQPSPMAKRLRPPTDQDQALVHCPRCESPNTKFCYYNNYSLTQPRYFCKACRRYWTKGGTLRNIPIGGVSRRNKKVTHHRRRDLQPPPPQQYSHYDKVAVLSDGVAMSPNSISLQLSRPESPNPDLLFEDLTIDFMDRGGSIRNYNCGDYFPIGGYRPNSGYGPGPFGETMSYYDEQHYEGGDVKSKVFDLECRDQMGVGRNGLSGYLLGVGSSWSGLVNGYGSSSTNSLV